MHAKQLGRLAVALLLASAQFHPPGADGAEPYAPVSSDPIRQPWRWRTPADLAGQGLRAVAEGPDGRMWFGTARGVVVYDGVNWDPLPLRVGEAAVPVHHVLVTADDVVHAATSAGLFVRDGDGWTRQFPEADGPADWFISDLEEAPDGSVWAATALGALRLREGRATLLTTAETAPLVEALAPATAIEILPEAVAPREEWTPRGAAGPGMRIAEGNHLAFRQRGVPRIVRAVAPGGAADEAGIRPGDWITAVGGTGEVSAAGLLGPEGPVSVEVRRVDGTTGTFELHRGAVPGRVDVPGVHDVLILPDGGVALAMQSGHVLVRSSGEWRRLPGPPQESGRQPRIAATPDGILWMVFQDLSGLGVFSLEPGRRTWSQRVLVPGGPVKMTLTLDRQGGLWVGAHNGYLMSRRDGRWVSYTDLDLPSTRLVGMRHSARGDLWLVPLGAAPVLVGLTSGDWETYEGLYFLVRTRDGSDWFVAEDDGVVRRNDGGWVRWGTEDGLMRYPLNATEDAAGHLWVGGSDGESAAVSRFDGRHWETHRLPRLASAVERRSLWASASGSVWIGARPEPTGHPFLGGVAEFAAPRAAEPDPPRYHVPPQTLAFTYGITEAHGAVWTGGYRGLRRFDGSKWDVVLDPGALAEPSIDVLFTDARGSLWIGHRFAGVLRYDGESWQEYGPADGLPEGRIRGLADDGKGGLWAAVGGSFARFDGETWFGELLPPELPAVTAIQKVEDALWLVAFENEWPSRNRDAGGARLVSHLRRSDTLAPETRITRWTPEVGFPGTAGLAWEGRDPWEVTAASRLQFSWRMDAGPWSVFARETERTFPALEPGEHVFEVRARDADFNVDPTPSVVTFSVAPPAWRQPWVLGLVAVLLAAACWQTLRLVRRDRDLRAANEELEKRVEVRTRDLADLIRELEAKNAELERFTYTISHDLKSPLFTIRGFGGSLLADAKVGRVDRVEEDLARISAAADRMQQLLDDVLELSRVGRVVNPSVRVDLRDVALEAVATLDGAIREKGARVNVEPLPEATVDRSRLVEVFQNLIQNGLKFSSPGRPPELVVGWRRGDEGDVITVRDEGIGIPPEHHQRVFELFERLDAEAEGTGIGLALAKRIVEHHGGRMWVESEGAGRGSTFCFTLGRAAEASPADRA